MNPEMLGGGLVNLSAGHCLRPRAGSEGQLPDLGWYRAGLRVVVLWLACILCLEVRDYKYNCRVKDILFSVCLIHESN